MIVLGGHKGFNWQNTVYSESGAMSSVLMYQTNDIHSGHTNMPSMFEERYSHACSIFSSPAHNGRPVAIAAAGFGYGSMTAEVLDYTIIGKPWEFSKYTSTDNFSLILLFTSYIKR